MGQQSDGLPSAYEELGIISSSKAIELPLYGIQIAGIKLTQKEYCNTSGYKFIYIDDLFAIRNQLNGQKLKYVYDGIDTGSSWGQTVIGVSSWADRANSFYTIEFLNGKVLFNDVQKTTYTKTESGWVCNDYSIPLTVSFLSGFCFKSLKVYGLDEETIIGDFIGCKRKSNNTEGLYDFVTKRFYS